MKRRNFLTVALGMLLLPFVKLTNAKPALTPWMPKMHPRQAALFNSDKPICLVWRRRSKPWIVMGKSE